jgi:hypothetical protein
MQAEKSRLSGGTFDESNIYHHEPKRNTHESANLALLHFLKMNRKRIKRYVKTGKVLARPAKVGERVQTHLNGRTETDVRIAKQNEWVVSNTEGEQELMLVDDSTFRRRYDAIHPLGTDAFKVYSPKNAFFFGMRYPGDEITFAPPSWGGTTHRPFYMAICWVDLI